MSFEEAGEASVPLPRLQAFLTRNPEAEIRTAGLEPIVCRLWGEDDIEIPIPIEDVELFEALNAVRLPPRFTAIWHEDTKEFEVIYTVLTSNDPILQRRFVFLFRERRYNCSFEPSSTRLLTIAQRARSSSSRNRPLSYLRNLQFYYRYLQTSKESPESDYVKEQRPTSFWIRGIDTYDDDQVEDLVRSLNFYMYYFDRRTPRILINEEPVRPRRFVSMHPQRIDPFPETLSGQDIDRHLLLLWETAHIGDPFLRFLHYYQILEYAGFYHVRSQVRREVERALVAPETLSRPDKAALRIVNAISADRRPDNDKINAMVYDCVDVEEMWEVLQGSLEDFSEDVVMDGGFRLPALVSANANYEEFRQSWKQFPIQLHKVRNALVHARESRQSTTIAPTPANRARLFPWLLPLSETAVRVMLYSRL